MSNHGAVQEAVDPINLFIIFHAHSRSFFIFIYIFIYMRTNVDNKNLQTENKSFLILLINM